MGHKMAFRTAAVSFLGLLIATAVAVVGTATWADAKATYESPYGYARTWNAAMRLVRVDNGWKVTEKDESNGYLLFEYRSLENAKAAPGSIELVRSRDSEEMVSVVVQLPQMPHYHEQVILDGLAAKMRREYGDPPEARHPSPGPDSPPDGGEAE
jgi:hypothetical protein